MEPVKIKKTGKCEKTKSKSKKSKSNMKIKKYQPRHLKKINR